MRVIKKIQKMFLNTQGTHFHRDSNEAQLSAFLTFSIESFHISWQITAILDSVWPPFTWTRYNKKYLIGKNSRKTLPDLAEIGRVSHTTKQLSQLTFLCYIPNRHYVKNFSFQQYFCKDTNITELFTWVFHSYKMGESECKRK